MFEDFENYGLDVFSQRYNKVEHKTHSGGRLDSTKWLTIKAKKQNEI